MKLFSPYIILPFLCLLSGYYLAVVSLVWGKFRRDSIYLTLICIWWTLLSYAFIYQHFETDPVKIMSFERTIHTLFVFDPVVSMLFYQSSIRKIKRIMIAVSFLICLAFAFTVHTPYYFYDFYHYNWGMIAKGGTAFKIFSLFSLITIIYIITSCLHKIITEKNHVLKLKYNYVLAAFIISSIFKMSNLPAMHGINFYPLSNLEFIPLGLLTYGIIKYRMVVFSGVFPQFFSWIVISSLIVVPNMFIFILIKNNFNKLGTDSLLFILIVWYFVNYYYSIKIQPLINQIFNRRNYNLTRMQNEFIDDIASLKNLDELVKIMISMLKKALHVENASLYIRRGYAGSFIDSLGNVLDLEYEAEELLLCGDIYEKGQIESELGLYNRDSMLLPVFDYLKSEYLIALVHDSEMIAILAMKKKMNLGRLRHNEMNFIYNLSSYVTIALANSVMYQNLSDMKINLEKIVEERTALIERQKSDMENDIQLARKIQTALLPAVIPDLKKLKVAYKYEPIMAVGGDFIDIHYREGMNELGIFICDVSGHGASSAMIAAMVKMSLDSWGEYIQKPSNAFKQIREHLKGKIGDNFITAYMCFIDLRNGVITSVCAGHPPMLIIRNDGSVEKVKPSGVIIIETVESEYEVIKKNLYQGDKIVLYTDGVFEARTSSGEIIGEDNFIRMLSENSSLSAKDLCETIYNEIFSRTGNIIDDDFALFVAQYTG